MEPTTEAPQRPFATLRDIDRLLSLGVGLLFFANLVHAVASRHAGWQVSPIGDLFYVAFVIGLVGTYRGSRFAFWIAGAFFLLLAWGLAMWGAPRSSLAEAFSVVGFLGVGLYFTYRVVARTKP